MAESPVFELGRAYLNVYFLKVDAKGHSSIVKSNDADKVDRAFDEFENMVYKSVEDARRKFGCQYAEFWGWQGDGGLCILFDDDESKARRTAVEAAEGVLWEIEHLNERLSRQDVQGRIAVRIAVHKGNFRYKGSTKHGSIHSRELNWCAHLEAVTPTNTIAVSDDVYQIMGDAQAKYYRADGRFEREDVYLKSERGTDEVQAEWRAKTRGGETSLPLESDVPVGELGLKGVFSQRALTERYRSSIARAKVRIWALGVSLSGFHSDHFPTVIGDRVKADVDVRLLILDPSADRASIAFGEVRASPVEWWDRINRQGEHNKQSCSKLLHSVSAINNALASQGKRIELRATLLMPSAAIMIVDDDAFFSPYLTSVPSLKNMTLWAAKNGRMYDKLLDHFSAVWRDGELTRDVPLEDGRGS